MQTRPPGRSRARRNPPTKEPHHAALPSSQPACWPPLSLRRLPPCEADAGRLTPSVAARPKLPICGLAPSKIAPDLCVYRYRVSTRSPECQAFFDQGFGYFYSYVWMEAARSFETAAQHDPDCAMAWWGLSRSLEKWGRGDPTKALLKAGELRDKASPREQQLILARMQEKGLVPGVGDADARKAAADRHHRQHAGRLRRRRGGVVLPGAAGHGGKDFGGDVGVRAVLQGAAAGQSAAPRRQPRAAALLRELPPPRPGLDLRGELHQVVAGHPAPVPHAGPPGDAPRPLGQDQRPLRPRHRAGTRLPQGDERQAGEDCAVLAPPGDPAGVADPRRPLRRGPGDQGGGRGGRASGSGRPGIGWPWPSATGRRR